MKKTELPTLQEIEELTAYLPRLYAEGFSPIETWEGGGKKRMDPTLSRTPGTAPLVEEFFRNVSEAWLDHDYDPEQAYQMLKDENLVKAASLARIKTMLTYCVRGERFSDGHWGAMIQKGYICRLLERLNEIKVE